MMCGHYSISEAWISPSITMLQNTTSTKNQGFAVSIYNLALAVSALSGTIVLGKVQDYFEASTHPEMYGYTLAGVCAFAYISSIPMFLKTGFNYKA